MKTFTLLSLCFCLASLSAEAAPIQPPPIVTIDGKNYRETATTYQIKDLTERIEKDRTVAGLYRRRGQSWLSVIRAGNFWDEEGDLPKAKADFERAIELEPLELVGYIARANAEKSRVRTTPDQKELEASLKWLDLAVERMPANAEAHLERVKILGQLIAGFASEGPQTGMGVAMGNEKEWFEKLVADGKVAAKAESGAEKGLALMWRGQIALSQPTEAAATLKQLAPHPVEMQHEFAGFGLEGYRARRLPLVKFWLERATSVQAASPNFLFLQSQLLLEQKKSSEALQLLNAVKSETVSPDILVARATLLARSGQIDSAIADLQRAVAADGTQEKNWYLLGYLQWQKGQLFDAVQSLTTSLELREAQREVWVQLGFVRVQQNQVEEAQKAFARGLRGASASFLQRFVVNVDTMLKQNPASIALQNSKQMAEGELTLFKPEDSVANNDFLDKRY